MKLLIEEIQGKFGSNLRSCLVTNERGLIIAASGAEQDLSEKLAAMMSLASDSALRISEHVGLEATDSIRIKGQKGVFTIYEFPVHGRRFRMGVLFTKMPILKKVRRGIFKRSPSVEQVLADAASKIRKILEE